MKMKKSNVSISFDDLLDNEYGKKGTPARDDYERGFETFKLGVLIEAARKSKNLTQEELADRCGTNKSYISRIENDASDIRLSTLTRIIQEGLGGKLQVSIEF